MHQHLFACHLAVMGLLLTLCSAPARADVLYDATLGTTPDDQGWLFLALNGSQSVAGGLLTFDSTILPGDDNRLIYGREDQTLNATAGFTLRMDMRIVEETHISRDDNGDGKDDRAGFSVIVLSDDTSPVGLELAFFEDRVWAYEDDSPATLDLFTQAEGAAFDTTAAMTRYDLAVSGSGYTLYINGSATPALTGPLRSYVNFSGPIDPYETPNTLIFGDNTTSARSKVELARVELLPGVVPEPTSASVLLVGGAGLLRRRRR